LFPFTTASLVLCAGVDGNRTKQLNEAKQSWNEYLRSFPNLEGKWVETITYSDDRPTAVYENEFICDYPNVYYNSKPNNGDYVIHLESNKKYSFSLRDPKENGPMLIDDCALLGVIPEKSVWSFPANNRSVNRNSSVNLIAEALAQGLLLSHKWLPVLVECPDFVLESFEESIQDGTREVRIKFSNNPKGVDDAAILMNIRQGEVTLLPDHYWLIKEGTCFFWAEEDPYTVNWKNEYDFTSFAVPVLRKRSLESFYVDGRPKLRRDNVYDYQLFENSSRKNFTLSDYGLPEPDFGERRVNRVRYTLMIVGSLMIVIALWQMYQKRKENKA